MPAQIIRGGLAKLRLKPTRPEGGYETRPYQGEAASAAPEKLASNVTVWGLEDV